MKIFLNGKSGTVLLLLMHLPKRKCLFARKTIHIYLYVYIVCVYMYTFTYVCVYIHTHIHKTDQLSESIGHAKRRGAIFLHI